MLDDFEYEYRTRGRGEGKTKHPKVIELIHLSGRDFVVRLDNGKHGVGSLDNGHDGTLFFRIPYCHAEVTMKQIREALNGESL